MAGAIQGPMPGWPLKDISGPARPPGVHSSHFSCHVSLSTRASKTLSLIPMSGYGLCHHPSQGPLLVHLEKRRLLKWSKACEGWEVGEPWVQQAYHLLPPALWEKEVSRVLTPQGL